jgi:DNA-binding transcriptional LysR family regulator
MEKLALSTGAFTRSDALAGKMSKAASAWSSPRPRRRKSPPVLHRNGAPQTPGDLEHHSCITWKQPGRETLYNWEFAKDGKWFEVAVKGSLTVNDCGVALRAARDGMGITLWMEEWMQDDIASGRLVPLLQEWSPPFPGFYLFHPSRRQVPANLRAFVDVLKAATNTALHEVQSEDVLRAANG